MIKKRAAKTDSSFKNPITKFRGTNRNNQKLFF